MTNQTEIIELNENNCKEYTIEQLCEMIGCDPKEFEDNQETQKEKDLKELHKIDKELSKTPRTNENGELTKKYRDLISKYMELAKSFMSNYGDEQFTLFRMYKTWKARYKYIIQGKRAIKVYKFNKRNPETGEY